MSLVWKIIVGGFLASLFCTAECAQQITDANEVLKRTRETYVSLHSFQLAGVNVTELRSQGTESRVENPFEAAFVAPSKLRIETRSPVTGILFVSDGQTGWIYSPSTKIYSKFVVASLSKTPGTVNEEKRDALSGFVGGTGLGFDIFHLGILNGVKVAKILNEEDVDIEGKKVKCFVVRVDYDSCDGRTVGPHFEIYWIDKIRYVILREHFEARIKSSGPSSSPDIQYSVSLTKVRLNESLSEQLFTFKPPVGAIEANPEQAIPPSPASLQ